MKRYLLSFYVIKPMFNDIIKLDFNDVFSSPNILYPFEFDFQYYFIYHIVLNSNKTSKEFILR
jgi:hypothetical protein